MKKLYQWFFRKIMLFSEEEKYCQNCIKKNNTGITFNDIELLFLIQAAKYIKHKAHENINYLQPSWPPLISCQYNAVILDSEKALRKLHLEIIKRKLEKSNLENKINDLRV